MSEFGTKGFVPGQLIEPLSITLDTAATGLVYVRLLVKRFIIVSQSLVMVCLCVALEELDQFCDPCGLAFNKDGFVCICDFNNYHLLVI